MTNYKTLAKIGLVAAPLLYAAQLKTDTQTAITRPSASTPAIMFEAEKIQDDLRSSYCGAEWNLGYKQCSQNMSNRIAQLDSIKQDSTYQNAASAHSAMRVQQNEEINQFVERQLGRFALLGALEIGLVGIVLASKRKEKQTQ